MKLSSLMLFSTALLVGCGGSGSGSPPGNGGPSDPPPPPPPPSEGTTLAQLQEDIFSPICSQCHIGSSAPEGLRLDSEQNSFDLLVDVPSGQQPAVLRVAPGEPDDSYIVRKLEGAEGITGGQMPLGGTPLSSARIAEVRDWITNGAPREGTGEAPTSLSMAQAQKSADLLTFELRFSRPIDAHNLNDALELYLYDEDQHWLLWPDAYDVHLEHDQAVTITFSDLDMTATGIELIVNGPASSLMDHNQRPIDANKDGQEGGSARYEYRFE